MKLTQQSWNVHMVTSHTMVLPAATGSAAHHSASCMCHYSSSDQWLQYKLIESVNVLQYIQNNSHVNPHVG